MGFCQFAKHHCRTVIQYGIKILFNAHLDQPGHRPHGRYSNQATCAQQQHLATRMLPLHYSKVETLMLLCSLPDSTLDMRKMIKNDLSSLQALHA